ncbi:MAG: tRNA (adenosine(37)-N6)-threonylcarbamoyltransferase complex dimerization subunit type 1 TsaB [Candidatus Puniceispirillaceae bacterium]
MTDSQNKTESQTTKSPDTTAPVILSLEASGEHASIALLRATDILAEARIDQRHGHASHFVSLADTCVKQAGLSFSAIDLVAGGVGPGSFTGLRVCLSAATGFALAGGLPSVGINGLAARAFAARQMLHQTNTPFDHIISLCDTRRGVYFAQIYDRQLNPVSDITEADMTKASAMADTTKGITFLAVPPFEDDSAQSALAPSAFITQMTASHIGQLAYHHWQAHTDKSADLPPLAPLYVAAPKLGPQKTPSS